MRGRINFLQLGRYGNKDEHSYRYQFAKIFDWIGFNRRFVVAHCTDERILGFDASYITKSGKTLMVWDIFIVMSAVNTNRLEIGCFAAIDLKQNTAHHFVGKTDTI